MQKTGNLEMKTLISSLIHVAVASYLQFNSSCFDIMAKDNSMHFEIASSFSYWKQAQI